MRQGDRRVGFEVVIWVFVTICIERGFAWGIIQRLVIQAGGSLRTVGTDGRRLSILLVRAGWVGLTNRYAGSGTSTIIGIITTVS